MPLLTVVFEAPDQFLLLAVDRNHGLAGLQETLHLPVKIPELSIAVGVLLAFERLGVGLQAVAGFVQQITHDMIAHVMPLRLQRRSQLTGALTRPAKRRHGIATCHRLDQLFEGGHQAGVEISGLLAAGAGPPNAPPRA
jgi:hypothetical protein